MGQLRKDLPVIDGWTNKQVEEWAKEWDRVRVEILERLGDDDIWVYAIEGETGKKLGGNPYGLGG